MKSANVAKQKCSSMLYISLSRIKCTEKLISKRVQKCTFIYNNKFNKQTLFLGFQGHRFNSLYKMTITLIEHHAESMS